MARNLRKLLSVLSALHAKFNSPLRLTKVRSTKKEQKKTRRRNYMDWLRYKNLQKKKIYFFLHLLPQLTSTNARDGYEHKNSSSVVSL